MSSKAMYLGLGLATALAIGFWLLLSERSSEPLAREVIAPPSGGTAAAVPRLAERQRAHPADTTPAKLEPIPQVFAERVAEARTAKRAGERRRAAALVSAIGSDRNTESELLIRQIVDDISGRSDQPTLVDEIGDALVDRVRRGSESLVSRLLTHGLRLSGDIGLREHESAIVRYFGVVNSAVGSAADLTGHGVYLTDTRRDFAAARVAFIDMLAKWRVGEYRPELLRVLSDATDDWRVRAAAARALAVMAHADDALTIAMEAQRATDPSLKNALLIAVAQFDDAPTAYGLLRDAVRTPEGMDTAAIQFSLVALRDRQSGTRAQDYRRWLLAQAERERRENDALAGQLYLSLTTSATTEYLAELSRDIDVKGELLGVVRDPSLSVFCRTAAASSWAAIASHDDLLAEVEQPGHDPAIRGMLVTRLAQCLRREARDGIFADRERIVDVIRRLIKDEDPAIVEGALWAAKGIQAFELSAEVLELAQSESSDPTVRHVAQLAVKELSRDASQK